MPTPATGDIIGTGRAGSNAPALSESDDDVRRERQRDDRPDDPQQHRVDDVRDEARPRAGVYEARRARDREPAAVGRSGSPAARGDRRSPRRGSLRDWRGREASRRGLGRTGRRRERRATGAGVADAPSAASSASGPPGANGLAGSGTGAVGASSTGGVNGGDAGCPGTGMSVLVASSSGSPGAPVPEPCHVIGVSLAFDRRMR